MNRLFAFSILVLSVGNAYAQSAEQVLAKSIAYHDPNGEWSSLDKTFYFKETRPSDSDRSTVVTIDNRAGFMKINRNDEEVYEVSGEESKVLKGEKGEERAVVLRNYYLYLWGLPMKLQDAGTPMDESVKKETLEGIVCDVLRVKYEKDTWYFYIDPKTG